MLSFVLKQLHRQVTFIH
uniref:Uncharacterized protein n=1 Tax=Rhizophora mucronata TaxID=61149 RepID=A0A2P2PB66_RHIMU